MHLPFVLFEKVHGRHHDLMVGMRLLGLVLIGCDECFMAFFAIITLGLGCVFGFAAY